MFPPLDIHSCTLLLWSERAWVLAVIPPRGANRGSKRRAAERWGNEECWDDGNIKLVCHFLKKYFLRVFFMWQKVEVKGRRKLLLLRRNITPVGKCWPRSSREPGWMWEPEGCPSRGLWWDGEAGAPLGTHSIPPCSSRSLQTARGGGRSKTWLRCCWVRVWDAAENLGQPWDKQRLGLAFLWQIPPRCSARNHIAPVVFGFSRCQRISTWNQERVGACHHELQLGCHLQEITSGLG